MLNAWFPSSCECANGNCRQYNSSRIPIIIFIFFLKKKLSECLHPYKPLGGSCLSIRYLYAMCSPRTMYCMTTSPSSLGTMQEATHHQHTTPPCLSNTPLAVNLSVLMTRGSARRKGAESVPSNYPLYVTSYLRFELVEGNPGAPHCIA